MKKLFFALALCLCACTSDSDFKKGKAILESQGYHDVTNTGYDAFMCSNSDDFSTGFKAVSAKGDTVKGCFCSAWGKGITIRYK